MKAAARKRIDGARRFVREYTAGFDSRDFQRLFERDAAQAYSVLTRDQAGVPEPEGRVRRLLHRTRILFLGLSYKLTPTRRVLFAASLVAAVLGFANVGFHLDSGATRVTVETSPLWFSVSIGGLVYLLALELVDRIRVRDELEVARQLQRDLLPREAPDLPGWRFAHSYRTANEVGGDYYDFQPLADGRLALVAGDASGHGMAAGLLMAIANATLKTAIEIDPDPVRVATLLNRTLCRTSDRRAFMTLFYALLEPTSGRLDYVCAGHPFPLLRRSGGEIAELGRGGLPLGLRPDLSLRPDAVTLAPGDLLLIYTDGLPEAVGAAGKAFGFPVLRELLARGGGPQEVHDRIQNAFQAHVGQGELTDDVTLVVVGRG